MKIIIVGDGKVGYTLAEYLSEESHDVTIIDKNEEALARAVENLDVMCICGSGANSQTLQEADAKNTDILIAVTSSDELNMICCFIGRKNGIRHTIARVRDFEYSGEFNSIREDFGIDMIINPEQETAYEISKILRYPHSGNVESFFRGNVEMLNFKLSVDNPLVGRRLSELGELLGRSILIAAVVRGDEIFIPNGSFVPEPDDQVYVIGGRAALGKFFKELKYETKKMKNVMMIGASRIAYYLVNGMKSQGINSKLIDINRKKCHHFDDINPDCMVINGDGTAPELLEAENINKMDAFIALTDIDEENMISCMLASRYGVPKVVAKINRMDYVDIIYNSFKIDSVVSPKLITANKILRYVRSLENGKDMNHIERLYKIINGRAEAVEFIAEQKKGFTDVPLEKLNIKSGMLVSVIVRGGKIIIPRGTDSIMPDDRVIVITKMGRLNSLYEIIE